MSFNFSAAHTGNLFKLGDQRDVPMEKCTYVSNYDGNSSHAESVVDKDVDLDDCEQRVKVNFSHLKCISEQVTTCTCNNSLDDLPCCEVSGTRDEIVIVHVTSFDSRQVVVADDAFEGGMASPGTDTFLDRSASITGVVS